MSELKPCPFCGAMPETDGKLVQCYLMPCDFRRFKMPVEAWNARPIEDALNKRIAAQIAAHFCALECDDPDFLAAREAVLPFAQASHIADALGIKERE